MQDLTAEGLRDAILGSVDQLPALLLKADLDLKGGSLLDPRVVLEALLRVNRELRTTTGLITHNLAIAAIADRVLRFSSGRIAKVERPARKLTPQELEW